MNPNRLNIVLGLLLLTALVFGVHQTLTVKRLKSMAAYGESRGILIGGKESLVLRLSGAPRISAGNSPNPGSTEQEGPSEDAPEVKAGVEEKNRETSEGPEVTDANGKTGNSPGSPIAVSIGRDGKLRTGIPLWTGSGPSPSRRATHWKGQDTAARQPKGRDSREVPDAAKSRELLNLAQEMMQQGRYDVAEEKLAQSLEEDETNRMAWQQLARLQHKQGLTEAEINTYLDWMEASPGDAAPYYQLASTYARQGQDAEARYYLGEYESLSGGQTYTFSQAAAVYRQLEDRGEEGRVLSQWLATAPESVDARQAWADYNRRLGGYDVALTQYQQLASIMPNNPRLYQQIGDVYRQLGDYGQAQMQYENALNLRPTDTGILGRLADLNYQNGDLNGALAAYNEIIVLEPGSNAAERAQRRIISIEEHLQRTDAYPVN